MDIVFNVNPLGLEGLEATLTSLVRNCSVPIKLNLWFLCSEFRNGDKSNIIRLLLNEAFEGQVKFIDYNSRELFGHLRPLHGDWSAYGRLLIPDYIKSESALYLDSDLIVMLDVLSLAEFEFNGTVLAAVCGSTVEMVLDKEFFLKRMHSLPSQKYFNSGVVLFNLRRWRETKAEEYWKILANKYPSELISHDQTLLNAICGGDFAHLPTNFNNAWYPGGKMPNDAATSIIHFVGSPKPWDVLGSIIHKGYQTWSSYTSSAWRKEYGRLSMDKIKRSWKIRRSIARHLRNMILDSSNSQ